MLVTTYDISNDKVRTKLSKFLCKYGRKIQYSVYEIRNSDRFLRNIKKEIELRYKKQFTGADSVVIVPLCEQCRKKVIRYGYAENDDKEVVVFD